MTDQKDHPGATYWRSVQEYARGEDFVDSLEREFEGYSPEEMRHGVGGGSAAAGGVSRRRFMQLAGASMALAGLTMSGCRRWPEEKIAPYAERPAGFVPGGFVSYATMLEHAGVARGLLVESVDGRPIKVEGNPQHPGSLGATDVYAQASLLEMYDPDRSRGVMMGRKESTWRDFAASVQRELTGRAAGEGGARLAVLAQSSGSPTLARLREQVLAAYPGATWHEWEPVNRDRELAGASGALGQPVRPLLDLYRARVVACFDSDLIGSHPNWVRHARDWSARRRAALGRADADEPLEPREFSRLWSVEPTFTVTGTNADERLPARAGRVGELLGELAAMLRIDVGARDRVTLTPREAAFLRRMAADLRANAGRGVVSVGPDQPAAVHALAWRINSTLNNVGDDAPVTLVEEPLAATAVGQAWRSQRDDVVELTRALDAGEIDTLLILGGNPVYDAPAGLNFTAAIARAKHSVHLSRYDNETSRLCDWHLPEAHPYEAWGDGRAWDGTVSIQQPLILPLFGGRSAIELLAALLPDTPAARALGVNPADDVSLVGYDLVRTTMRERGWLPEAGFEVAWRQALSDGVVQGTRLDSVATSGMTTGVPQNATVTPDLKGRIFEATFRPARGLYDGRFANNGWLQELPDAITKVVWDNPALISPADAKALNLEMGDLVEITVGNAKATVPVFPQPGQAPGSISLVLGYGRTAAGRVGGLSPEAAVGFDLYPLRSLASLAPDAGAGVAATIRPTGESYTLATTQQHHLIGLDWVGQQGVVSRQGLPGVNGKIIREASLAEFAAGPDAWYANKGQHDPGAVPLQLYEPPYSAPQAHPGAPTAFNAPHAWGMAIDMTACIGCNACVIACQSENNIPIVGKEMVAMNREMHWLRIDTYFKGEFGEGTVEDLASPEVVHQPMMCVHCENAPCEQVCPVAATVHDTEGLNVMVYNRCIGTRYCGNNCPYKVRRFNYFDYHSKDPRDNGVLAATYLGIPDQQQRDQVDAIKSMLFNPEVSVRMRGVMEKCTYCVQRIKRATITAKVDALRGERHTEAGASGFRGADLVRDEEVVTACQQACPTRAIVFGDLNDPDSKAWRLHADRRAYRVLGDLNTRPRTQYLAQIRNPADV